MDNLLNGQDIAQILGSEGPVVKCVLLRCSSLDDRKQSSSEPLHPNVNLIEEVSVDTTPKKSMVAQILGGPFTFLGQYEEEGIVLMTRRDQDDSSLPMNPHRLQPPFADSQVRGDVLIVKVAPTEEVLDNEEEQKEDQKDAKELEVPSNQEFFLDYSKDEYVAFASRTDVVAPEPPEEEEDEEEQSQEEEEEEENDGDDEEYNVVEDDSDEEVDQVCMMNLILGQVLRKFHEENGRGPDTRELLALRSALAEKMGVPLPDVDEADWDQKAVKKKREIIASPQDESSPFKSVLTRKRTVEEEDGNSGENDDSGVGEAKRVKFSPDDEEEDAKKPAALPVTEKVLEVAKMKSE